MRVLLTGASGFIGRHAAQALSGAHHDLRVLVRPTSDVSGLAGIDLDRRVGDLSGNGLADACKDVDAVVHVAGVTSARNSADYHRVNARGTGLLAEAAARAGVGRFLYVSSMAAHGPSRDGHLPDPAAPCRPLTPYGESKAAGEVEALAFAKDMTVQVLRPPVVYGPADTGLLPFFKMARFRFMTILGRGDNHLAMVYGPDLADALVMLLAKDPAASPFFHISDAGGPYSWRQLTVALAEALDHRVIPLPLPTAGFTALALLSEGLGRLTRRPPMLDAARVTELRQPAWLSDSAALTDLTGWAPPTDLATGMRETVQWYRDSGWL